MTLRRICTIAGQAYTLSGNCPACDGPMWTTIEPPINHAGCTPTQCIQDVLPTSTTTQPSAASDPTTPSSDTDSDNDSDTWTYPE